MVLQLDAFWLSTKTGRFRLAIGLSLIAGLAKGSSSIKYGNLFGIINIDLSVLYMLQTLGNIGLVHLMHINDFCAILYTMFAALAVIAKKIEIYKMDGLVFLFNWYSPG